MAGRRTSGSVRQRSSGRWQARVRDPLTGRMIGLGTLVTKGDADRALTLAWADQTRGAWVDPARGRLSVADYATNWLADRPQLRPRSRELYEGILRLHILPALGHVELRKLTPLAVRRWHSGMLKAGRPGPPTVAKAYRLLHTIMATAAADELIVKNPCVIGSAGVERAPEREVITVAQVWELADVVEPRYRALVLMAAFTGLRRGELFGLTRRRLDLLHKTVTVAEQRQQLRDGTVIIGPPKTEAGRRTLALPRAAHPRARGASRRLHPARGRRAGLHRGEGRAAPGPRVAGQVGKGAGRARPPGPPLPRSSSCGQHLTAASGASTRDLMHRMGHVSPAAALRYQHATRDRDAAIAAALSDLIAPRPGTVTPVRTAATDAR